MAKRTIVPACAQALAFALGCGSSGGGDPATDTEVGSSSTAEEAGPATDPSVGSSDATTDASADGGTSSEASSDAVTDASSDTGTQRCTLADAWEIVDDYTPDADAEQAKAFGLGTDDAGNVYVVGTIDQTAGSDSGGRWIVRRTSDGAASWEIIDEFVGPAGLGANATDVAVDGDGRVFVNGAGMTLAGEVHRIVRRSEDGGASWESVEDYVLAPGFDTYSGAMAIAPSGTIWTTGQSGAADSAHVVIRESTDSGDTWSTALDYQHVAGQICLPGGLAIAPDESLLVTGRCFVAPMESHWIAGYRTDGVWAIVDDFVVGPGGTGGAGRPFFGDVAWVAGGGFLDDVQHWVVRRADAIDQWTTVDDHSVVGSDVAAGAIIDHGDGTLVAIGTQSAEGESPRMITRRSDDDGATWATVDDFAYGSAIYAGDLTIDAAGHVYAQAIAIAADGRAHWLVRRLPCE